MTKGAATEGGVIAITGATGYLGSAVIRMLAVIPGLTIRALSRGNAVTGAGETIIGSLSDPGACARLLAGADAVVHAAGLVRSTDVHALQEANVDGTRHLVDAARSAGVRRFVHLSSTGVYGTPRRAVDEASPRRPETPYERSKAEAEALVLAGATGAIVVQPSNVIGTGHPLHPLRRFLGARRSGRLLVHAGAWTNYVDVEDVALAVVAAAIEEDVPPVVIVNSPMPLTELARIAGAVLERPARVMALPTVVGTVALPPVRLVARRLEAFGRLEALMDPTRFATLHGDWLRREGVSDDLRPTLAAMAAEYGLA